MPSFDEQTILEELRAFPEFRLSAESSERIQERLRKQEPRIRARQRRSRSMNRAMTGLLACLAVIALVGLGSWLLTSDRAEPAAQSNPADAPYRQAAEQELRELGLKGNYKWETMNRDTGMWSLRTVGQEARVTFTPEKPQPVEVVAVIPVGKLPSVYREQKQAAIAVLREAGLTETDIRTVQIIRNAGGIMLYFQMQDIQYVSIDRDTGTVVGSRLIFRPEAVDPQLQSAALKALKPLAGDRTLTFTAAERTIQSGQPTQWQLSNEAERYSVALIDGTWRVDRLFYPSGAYHIHSAQEAMEAAKPLIREIFGTDVTGYRAYGGRNIGGYVLHKKDQPSFSVVLDDLETGTFFGLVRWEP